MISKTTIPNYKQIYIDIIKTKFPEKMEKCASLLHKADLSQIDIIDLNNRIFEGRDKEIEKLNQRLRSYNISSIKKILDYQKKYKYNNSQLANHFGLSRNTVTKWKKMISEHNV
ncbi:helix-turn-helix domain-containing protein [Chryseobacterium sp. JV274]|uniref:helix-turn-helix domain-containing protein n=1 Tax=Chryseobacterium sp. JV274 TaxID=1932669 RepID=UPI0015C2091E|nr:helix-turn-helix domain-containing protein [Chryseobacterium sp. JV274]CAD0218247.1 Helix-turn-helix domain-containing protein [Chryseobacterium sp. JV274]